MKLLLLPLALLPRPSAAAHVLAARGGEQQQQQQQRLSTASSSRVTPQDLAECTNVAVNFIQGPKAVEDIPNLAVDFCVSTTSKKSKDKPYFVCMQFRDAVLKALEDQPAGSQLTAEGFCGVAEARMLETRGAVRVPHVGEGPLTDFKLSKSCATLAKSVSKEQGHRISRADAGDVWYSMCLHQDCSHYLPSRTKWCSVDKMPTHSAWVCGAARKFMAESARGREKENLSPAEVCGLYSNFVQELGVDVEAYEHVMHADSAKRVPAPEEAAKALISSQLLNDAGARALRDGGGAGARVVPAGEAPPSKGGAAGGARAALLPVVLLAAAAALAGAPWAAL